MPELLAVKNGAYLSGRDCTFNIHVYTYVIILLARNFTFQLWEPGSNFTIVDFSGWGHLDVWLLASGTIYTELFRKGLHPATVWANHCELNFVDETIRKPSLIVFWNKVTSHCDRECKRTDLVRSCQFMHSLKENVFNVRSSILQMVIVSIERAEICLAIRLQTGIVHPL